MKNLINIMKLRFIIQVSMCFMTTLLFQNNTFGQTCTSTYTITSSNNQSSMFGTGFTNTTVYITSDFYIDSNFTISGCTVKIDPSIRIIVEAGRQLTITSGATPSHLSACTNMWEGITIEGSSLFGNGFLRINNNTLIEDAEHAVFIPNASSGLFRIQNSTFNKNWIHILIDHISGNQYSGGSSVENSNFFCKDLTTNIYTNLLIPHSTSRTFHAISYRSAGIGPYMTIGSGNVVENADIGIYNFNSRTDVIDSYIHDCNIGYYGAWDGTMRLYNCEVRNCSIGIESTNSMSYVEITKNEIFRISNKGIYVHSNRADVSIFKNSMYEILDGIVIIDNNNNAAIHDNNIYNGLVASFPGSHAVYVQQPFSYPSITLNITANKIAQFEQGIFVSTFDKTTIRGNYIDMDFIIPGLPYQIFAIKIENSDFFGVALNTIKGNTTSPNYCDLNTCGIFVENCNEGGVICNELGDSSFPIQFTFNKNLLMKGIVNGNFIGGNKFRFEHLWSLFILDSPDGLGVQGDPYYVTDNEWLLFSGSAQCGYSTQDVISDNSHTSISAITEFHVRAGAPFEHDAPTVLFGFLANPNVVSASPMPDQLCTFLRFFGGNLENAIADGTAFNNNTSDAYKWYSQNWLYSAIPEYPMYSNSQFNNFYTTLDNGNHGALKRISNQLNTNNYIISTSSFVPSNSVEEKIKNMIDIGAQVNNQGINSISIIQKSIIDDLSILCPQEDGPGVYMARAMRSLLDRQLFEYSSACSSVTGSNLRKYSYYNSNDPTPLVNYSNKEFKVTSKTIEIYCIDIFDISGKKLFSSKMNSNTSKFINLPAGIYLYVLTPEQNIANSLRGKLTIINN